MKKAKISRLSPGALVLLQKGSTYRVPGTILWYKIDKDEFVFVVSSEKKPFRITCLRTDGRVIAFDGKFEGFNELTTGAVRCH